MPISPSELERIDRAIKTQLDILRHSANTEARILELLEGMRRELIGKLARGDLTNWSRARVNQLIKDANTTITEYYARAQAMLAPTYAAVAGVSAHQTALALAVTIPSRAVLESLLSNVLIEGAPLKAWWGKMASDTQFKFSAAVRQGIAQGETMEQIFKRVNAAVDMAGMNSRQLVQTSIMQVMNDARQTVVETNADDKTQVEYLATLDSHTCTRCAPRDGLRWYAKSKKPVGHTLQWQAPPIHIGCRCTSYEVTVLSDMIEGGRASQFGVVSGKTTFGDFLKWQTPEFQNEVLGKGRAEMYRAGKITLRDLVSGNGAPLTLKQLERKYK